MSIATHRLALSGAGSVQAARTKTSLSLPTRRRLFFVMIGLPAVVYVLAVAGWPLAQGIWYSFFDYNLLRPGRRAFVGLENYVRLFADETARRAVVNTFVFTVLAVAVEFALGFGLALLLWRDSLFNRIALTLMLIPVAITPLAVGLIFRALLAPDFGLVGYYAVALGLSDPRGFFADAVGAMGALILIDVWQWTPLVALILLAGLKALPSDVLEAARVDGAAAWQRLWLIVVPLLLPTIFLALVLRTMDAFRVFDSIYVTTKGGPDEATNVLLFYAVKEGFEFFNIGFASAVSNLMIACIGLFAFAFVILIRRADRRING